MKEKTVEFAVRAATLFFNDSFIGSTTHFNNILQCGVTDDICYQNLTRTCT